MPSFHTYMDLDFIDRFTRERPKRSPLVRSTKEKLWDNVAEYLRDQTDVIIDAPASRIEEIVQENPLVRDLIDRPEGTVLKLRSGAVRQAEPREGEASTAAGHPWQLFLLQSIDGHPAVRSETNRQLYLNYEELEYRWPHLMHWRVLNVSSNVQDTDMTSWDSLDEAAVPHVTTGIIVCDRYMLKSKNSRQNVVDLLATLLVKNGTEKRNIVPVSILLITEKDKVQEGIEMHQESIRKELALRRPTVRFKLSIVATKIKDYHDRHIFTNYAFIKSGHSLDYFKYRDNQVSHVLKNTTFDVGLKLCSDVLLTAQKKIRELDTLLKKTHKNNAQIVGDPNHPLIEASRV
jgi:hypothetical protein